jgi:PTS system mannose-specific IIA component
MIGVIVITHGQFGVELLRTAEDIVGRQEAAVVLPVVAETGIDVLAAALDGAARQLQDPQGILVLVDMLGGTPCNTALLRAKGQDMEVVTGVNLYMLISAFTHRDQMDLKALAQKAMEDGKRAIVLAKELLAKRAT